MQHATRKIFLHPGEFVFTESGTHVHTILGSCVAICLWNPLLKIGGMCHFLLPSRPAGTVYKGEFDGRYGDEAMQLFDQAIKLHHTRYHEYQAEIFGGANATASSTESIENLIGKRNIEKAKQLVSVRQIEIKTVQVSEARHQRIMMDFSTGHVRVLHSPAKNAINVRATG